MMNANKDKGENHNQSKKKGDKFVYEILNAFNI